MGKSEGRLKSKRVALTVVSVIGLLAIPRGLHADIVFVDFSGTYFVSDNPAITGTFAGTLTFDNTSGMPRQGGAHSDMFAGDALCLPGPDHCSFADGVFTFWSFLSGSAFFIEETSLVGITDLTPRQISGIYGGFVSSNPFFPPAFSFSSITYAHGVVVPVPEPSAILLLATGLVLLFLRALAPWPALRRGFNRLGCRPYLRWTE